jgi:deazaflavin-dependent oxidoreductase (nitroreductase family)
MSAPLPQYLYLTTRGRRTGLARQIEIWFTEGDGRYYIIAEHDNSHWLQNLRADSHVQIRIGDSESSGRARALDPAADRELIAAVQERSRRKYGWGEGTVVEITPDAGELRVRR